MSPKPTDKPTDQAMENVYTLVARLSSKYKEQLEKEAADKTKGA